MFCFYLVPFVSVLNTDQWYQASQPSQPIIGLPSSWPPHAGQIHTWLPSLSYNTRHITTIPQLVNLSHSLISHQYCQFSRHTLGVDESWKVEDIQEKILILKTGGGFSKTRIFVVEGNFRAFSGIGIFSVVSDLWGIVQQTPVGACGRGFGSDRELNLLRA